MLSATPNAGDEIRILADGTYTRSATGTVAYANGTQAANIIITGANSSGTVDGSRPTIQASAGSITLLNITGNHILVDRLIVDGNSQAATVGLAISNSYLRARRVKAINCTSKGIDLSGSNSVFAEQCEATGCSGTCAISVNTARAYFCEAYGNTCHGFQMQANCQVEFCVSSGNTGSSDGFNCASVGYFALNCVAYGNGRAGFDLTGNAGFGSYLGNCIAYHNSNEGFATDGVKSGAFLLNCAGGNNTSGNYNATNLTNVENFVPLSGDPFADSSSADFSLNNTTGSGRACRATGFPGVLPRGTTTGFLDIGVAQHQDTLGTVGAASLLSFY
jgi:hypothetical protein